MTSRQSRLACAGLLAAALTSCALVPPAPQTAKQAYLEADAAFTALVQSADAAFLAGKLSLPDAQKAVKYEHDALSALKVARVAVDNDPTTIPGAITTAWAAIGQAKTLLRVP